jgi:hypothetical protein
VWTESAAPVATRYRRIAAQLGIVDLPTQGLPAFLSMVMIGVITEATFFNSHSVVMVVPDGHVESAPKWILLHTGNETKIDLVEEYGKLNRVCTSLRGHELMRDINGQAEN